MSFESSIELCWPLPNNGGDLSTREVFDPFGIGLIKLAVLEVGRGGGREVGSLLSQPIYCIPLDRTTV